MVCPFCHKELPENAFFCCYCGKELGKYVDLPNSKLSQSYRLTSYSWVDNYSDKDYTPPKAINQDAEEYLMRLYSKSDFETKTYQNWDLFQYSNSNRIILKITDNFTRPPKVFVANDFSWLHKELASFGNKILSEVIDYTLIYRYRGFEWTLADYHGGDSFDVEKNKRNSFLRIYKQIAWKYEDVEYFPILFNPDDLIFNNSHQTVRQLWDVPGDLNFEIVTLVNRAGKEYSCPFINGHALSRRLRDVLSKEYGIDFQKKGSIPKSFFEKYVLSEVSDDGDNYVTSNLWYTVSVYPPFNAKDIVGEPE